MAESESSPKPQKFLLSESDTATDAAAVVAAQQLMQLSDEDNNKSEKSSNFKKKNKSSDDDDDEEGEEEDYVQSKVETSWAKTIEEIFGKEDEEEICRPRKRRYRTLVSLYLSTKPMPLDMYRKKMRH